MQFYLHHSNLVTVFTARVPLIVEHPSNEILDSTYISVVSSGKVNGTFAKLFSRQSTIPSAQRHGCGHKLLPPHSIGACSVNPTQNVSKRK